MKPKILLTPYHCEPDSKTEVSFAYTNAVIKSGGLPLVCALTDDKKVICEYICECDGIILTGGGDIDPEFIGLEKNDKFTLVSRLRDEFEFELVRAAYELDKPVLGICRGLQVINAVFGGTIYDDISGHRSEFPREVPVHYVKTSGKLSEIYPTDAFVNSFHHQVIERAAENFDVCAISSDGYIEGICAKDKRFFMGVQWHPENLPDAGSKALFDTFVNACK